MFIASAKSPPTGSSTLWPAEVKTIPAMADRLPTHKSLGRVDPSNASETYRSADTGAFGGSQPTARSRLWQEMASDVATVMTAATHSAYSEVASVENPGDE